jgi:dihydrolipoamide dehydrogenase
VVKVIANIQERNSEGFVIEAAGETYTGEQLLIATGSVPIVPGIEGLKESIEADFTMTNREILQLMEVPQKLTVIGGGVIGLEMASYYVAAGSDVTVIEMLDHIAGQTDTDIGLILKKSLEKKGIKFLLESKVMSVDKEERLLKILD